MIPTWIIVIYSLLVSILLREVIIDNTLYLLSTIPAGILGGIIAAWWNGAFDE